MKILLYLVVLVTTLYSCDVRRKDKVADGSIAAKAEAASHDSTTVTIIDEQHDFGTVKDGEKVHFSFRFVNSGNKPLVISNAQASCGCTVPEKPEKPIMPGDTSYIKVVFNSQGKVGHVEKTISVSSNANPPFPTLYLKGEVAENKEENN